MVMVRRKRTAAPGVYAGSRGGGERGRSAHLAAMQFAVTHILSEAETISGAVGEMLGVICGGMEWDFGKFWRVEPVTGLLRMEGAWCREESPEAREFVEACSGSHLPPGGGLPGRVLASGRPMRVDIGADGDCPAIAAKLGLRTAFAFPLRIGPAMNGVIAFYSRASPPLDDALLNWMGDIGQQVGQFIGRMEAVEILKESERRNRILSETVVDVLWMMDLDLRATYVSPSVTGMLGYSVGEAMAMELEDLLIPASFRAAADAFHGALSREGSGQEHPPGWNTLELELYRKDRTTRWVEIRVNFLRDTDGKPAGVVGVARDITERRRAYETLRENEERYRTLVESARDAIVCTDSRGNIVSWNAGAQAIFGYREEEVLGEAVTIIIPLQFREGMMKGMERMREVGAPAASGRTVDGAGLRSDGTEFPAEVSISIWWEGGEQFFTAIIRDITERKRAEEERRAFLRERARAELQNFIVSALPVFTAGVHSSARDALVGAFVGRFERKVRPRFEAETARRPGTDRFREYTRFMTELLGDLGIRTALKNDGNPGRVEFLNCPWRPDSRDNPVFCMMCRGMMIRSFTWTGIDGSAVHISSIAGGADACRFDYTF